MSNCPRNPILRGLNLDFRRNEIKCPIVQESQFLVDSTNIFGEIKSNVQMYKNPIFWWAKLHFWDRVTKSNVVIDWVTISEIRISYSILLL